MTQTTPDTFVKVHPLPLAAARWTSGFWADRFKQCNEVMVPTPLPSHQPT